ncbi:response regulator [Ktedonobacter racemifer]|uniref:Two component transcriptional regulator, LuxR family n=1 Tax=Ktedonobacter racemifer DSM 44963 TaxID=485913 RepID=D6TRX1_KTERA|nr:response regulator transcription factor [Ktedonobacter racemifer]EFH86044.1 two component transcriptional regulator, LuxR family [Ktedonobacter racemifer DSM 44963]
MSESIRVLIVDDHAIVRHGLRTLLETEADFEVVGDVASGAEALLLVDNTVPDVILMDLVMPGLDGVETTRLLKQRSPCSQIIVLTSYHEDEHIFPTIRAGALSYLLKEAALSELTEAIRKAARGEVVLHPHVAARVLQELRGTNKDASKLYATLSEREREVLNWIAQGLSNGQIAARLVISERTVKSHVNNILGKLQVSDRTQAAIYVWREGMVKRVERE